MHEYHYYSGPAREVTQVRWSWIQQAYIQPPPRNKMPAARGTMYALLAAQPLTNWVIRGGLPSLIQFVVEEYALADAQKAMLLGAFYPGYLLTQIPSGIAIQKVRQQRFKERQAFSLENSAFLLRSAPS